jgi:hypothetical protein
MWKTSYIYEENSHPGTQVAVSFINKISVFSFFDHIFEYISGFSNISTTFSIISTNLEEQRLGDEE